MSNQKRPSKAYLPRAIFLNMKLNSVGIGAALHPRNLLPKAMGMIINLDKMCGGMFEKGLARAK